MIKISQTTDKIGELLRLSHRILKEEIKVFNDASRVSCGVQLIYVKDRTFWIREYSRSREEIIKIAEEITEKKLVDINFKENQIDQLKVRIGLRKFFSKKIFEVGFLRFGVLLRIAKTITYRGYVLNQLKPR